MELKEIPKRSIPLAYHLPFSPLSEIIYMQVEGLNNMGQIEVFGGRQLLI
jgi:hypothetical protein